MAVSINYVSIKIFTSFVILVFMFLAKQLRSVRKKGRYFRVNALTVFDVFRCLDVEKSMSKFLLASYLIRILTLSNSPQMPCPSHNLDYKNYPESRLRTGQVYRKPPVTRKSGYYERWHCREQWAITEERLLRSVSVSVFRMSKLYIRCK